MIERHMKVLELIKKHPIGTQVELARHLCSEGHKVTQATVSRDIKKLGLLKRTDSQGKSRYVANEVLTSDSAANHYGLFSSSIIGMDYVQNLIVIKALPGMAQAIAAAVDSMLLQNILGTIAGDDTLLLVARDNTTAQDIIKLLQSMR